MNRIYPLLARPQVRFLGRWGLRAIGPIILVVLLVRVVDYGELRRALADMNIGWGLAALAAMELIILLRTYRWIDIHRAFGLPRASFLYQLRLSYATMIATVALPQILSPFSRLLLMLQDGYRGDRTAAGSAIEKVLELAAYVLFGVIGTIFLAGTFGGLVWWAFGISLASAGVCVAFYLARHRLRELAEAVIERLPFAAGTGEAERHDVAEQIVSLNRTVFARLSAWSVLIALTQASMLYFLVRSLGVNLSLFYVVAVWGIIAFSLLLPISVNGVGTREAILVVAFNHAGKSHDAAIAAGLLVIVVGAVGSLPGLYEWGWRAIAGSGRGAADASQASPSLPPATQGQG
jgi:uncharacterized membrane protein YbhN (UPF0104 family)